MSITQTDLLRVGEFTLHSHQMGGISDLRSAIRDGVRRVVLQGPCGFGKTIVATALIHLAREKNSRVLVLTDSRQLVYQMSDKLQRCGIPHSIMMAGEEYRQSAVVVATKQTMHARCYAKDIVPKPSAQIVIVDEAHKSLTGKWIEILENYGSACQIGLTATPEDIGGWWDRIVVAGSYKELTPQYLAPCRVFIPWQLDMSGVSSSGGDYVAREAEKRHNQEALIGDVFANWNKIAPERRTVVFASGVNHSVALRDTFIRNGVTAAHVDATTPQRCTRSREGREKIFDDLRTGKIQVICNVGVCRVGWDAPWVECGVLAFSTKSLVRYIQTTGRLFRTFAAKDDAIVIDHGGNVVMHGWPTDDHAYELRPCQKIEKRNKEEREAGNAEEQHCPRCSYVWLHGKRGECPVCGFTQTRSGWPKLFVDGELREVVRRSQKTSWRGADQRVWDKCLGIAANVAGGSVSMAHAIYRRERGERVPDHLHNYLGSGSSDADQEDVLKKYRRGRRWS